MIKKGGKTDMKLYETPEIQVHKFEVEDVITASSNFGNSDNDLPFVPASINNVQDTDDNLDLTL